MAGRFSIEAFFKAIDGFSAPVAKMQTGLTKFTRSASVGLGQLNGGVDKAMGALKALGAATVAVGLVGGAAMLHVGEAGAHFEQAITNVGAVMGKNRGQIQELEKEAMRLGVVTQFSSSEVADAMEMMARKGFDSKEILAGIPGVLNAVAASGEGMAEVSTVVGSAIRGFGLEASQTDKVANILAFTAEKTGARITEMGEALSIAAPTAKTLGVSIEDTATAVGLLQKMGIDASTAGSATATMLAKISKPSKEAADKMAAMGIKFKDSKGNMLAFRDVLGQFIKVGDKAGGNMDRMAFFAELVGLRGDKAALGLADMAKSGDFDKLADGVRNVGDYAGKVAKIRMDTTMGSWKLLTSTVEVLETKLFNLKSGALRGVIDGTNAWIAANQDLIVQKVQDTIAGIADNLPKIVMWGERIGKIVGVFTAVAVAIKLVAAAQWVWNAAAAANPFTLWIVGLTIVTALLIAFWPEVKQAGEWIGRLSTAVKVSAVALGILIAVQTSSRVAMIASTAASWAYNAALAIGQASTTGFTASTIASSLASGAWSAVLWLRTAATTAYTTVTEVATAAMAAYRLASMEGIAATVAATISFAPFLVTVAAAAAAIGALVLAWNQWKALNAETGGLGITGTIGEMIKQGTFDPAKAVNTFQNQQAQANATDTTQMVPPRASLSTTSIEQINSTSRGEVTIRDTTGKAAITKKPTGGGFGLALTPSGAY
jgi:TP901 family phage tail tape measure protein